MALHPEQTPGNGNSDSATISRNICFNQESALLVVDCYGYISTLSQSAEQLFGYNEELLRGSSVRLLFPDLNGSRWPGYLREPEPIGIPKF